MNKLIKLIHLFCIILILSLGLQGCGVEQQALPDSVSSTEDVPLVDEPVSQDAPTEAIEPSGESVDSDPVAESETHPLVIQIINHCNITIGMVSIVDPSTDEQVNLSGLAADESIVMSIDWPNDVTEFNWAIYNQAGELCVESTTDISEASETIILDLIGSGDFEKVDTIFDEPIQ